MEQWYVVVMFCFVHDSDDVNVEFVRAVSRDDADTKARPQLIERLLHEEFIADAGELEIGSFAIVICTGDTEPVYPIYTPKR